MTDHQLPVHYDVNLNDMMRLAESIAKSRLFGIQTADQALVLMSISQAEGRHPALAARDFDIIQGKPAKKAEAMQRDFLSAGGKIEWLELSDTKACAKFSHPSGGTVTLDWDMKRADKAGLAGKDMWKKYPRQMLKARVIAEGVRTIFPTASSGMYVPEEVADFREMQDVTPAKEEVVAQVDQWRSQRESKPAETAFEDVGVDVDRLLAQGNAICHDPALLEQWWKHTLDREQRMALGATRGAGVGPYLPGWKAGEKQTRQASAVSDGPPEPPAGVGVPTAPAPQAEPQEDAFGLPQSDDEAFCASMLTYVRDCATQEAINNVKLTWSPGSLYYDHMTRLPKSLWENLMEQIGQHELSLLRRGVAA